MAHSPAAEAGVIDRGFGDRGSYIGVTEEVQKTVNTTGLTATGTGDLRLVAQVNGDVAMFAYRPDGSLDTDFHGRGWTVIEPLAGGGADWDMPEAAVRQGARGIVVAGGVDMVSAYFSYQRLTVTRIRENGEVDRSFGRRGSTTVRSLRRAISMSTDSRKRIVTLSTLDSHRPDRLRNYKGQRGEYGIARFREDGGLDRSFGRGGIVRRSIGVGSSASFVMTDGEDRVLAAGDDDLGTWKKRDRRFRLIRYREDGSIDRSFGTEGVAESPSFRFEPVAGDELGDGSLILAGRTRNEGEPKILRYLPDGSLDRDFASDPAIENVGSQSRPSGVWSLPHDRFAVAFGRTVLVMDRAGTPLFEAKVSPGSRPTAMVLSPDGRSLYSAGPDEAQPLLGRIDLEQGTNDPSVAAAGLPQHKLFASESSGIWDFAILDDGRLLGSFSDQTDTWSTDPMLFRLTADGLPDRSFGDEGERRISKVEFDWESDLVATREGRARFMGSGLGAAKTKRVEIGSSGEVGFHNLDGFKQQQFGSAIGLKGGATIAVGEDFTRKRKRPGQRYSFGFKVAKYTPSGRLDRRFGAKGIRHLYFDRDAVASGVDLDRRGRLVVAGGDCSAMAYCVDDHARTQEVTLTRLLGDGAIDRTFGDRGRVQIPYGRFGSAADVEALSDGRIAALVAHTCASCLNRQSLVTLSGDGSLQRRVELNIGRSFSVVSMHSAPHGGVDLAGTVEPCSSGPRFAVVRLDRRGRLDRRFGGGDGLLLGNVRKGLGSYGYTAIKPHPDQIIVGGYAEVEGRYGGAEQAMGAVRMNLAASDGRTELKACGQ